MYGEFETALGARVRVVPHYDWAKGTDTDRVVLLVEMADPKDGRRFEVMLAPQERRLLRKALED